MRTRVQELDNSLVLHIPKAFAAKMHITPNPLVKMSFVDGKTILVPTIEPELTLEQLLAGVTDENLHRAVDTGDLVGKEAW